MTVSEEENKAKEAVQIVKLLFTCY